MTVRHAISLNDVIAIAEVPGTNKYHLNEQRTLKTILLFRILVTSRSVS